MESNGKGMTQEDLENLPEEDSKVLWQDDDGPTTITDKLGQVWFIGLYQGKLCKQKAWRYLKIR